MSRTFWKWLQSPTLCWLDNDLAGMPSRSGHAQAQLPMSLALLPPHRGSCTPGTAKSAGAGPLTSSDKPPTQLPFSPDGPDKQPGSSPTDKTAVTPALLETWTRGTTCCCWQTPPAVQHWTAHTCLRERRGRAGGCISSTCRLLRATLLLPTRAYSLTHAPWHWMFTPGCDVSRWNLHGINKDENWEGIHCEGEWWGYTRWCAL